MRLVDALERADSPWCAIGGIAVNHWAEEPMATRYVDIVVDAESAEDAVAALKALGFQSERHAWSVNFKGRSSVSIQLSVEEGYLDYPSRAVAADVHGILMRVASLGDTLEGKLRAWRDPERRQSKRINHLADIASLVEAHAALWDKAPEDAKERLQRP